jgi:uncharacterized membrane protein YhaH (DUF805 family)
MSVHQLFFGFEGRFGRAMFWGPGIAASVVLLAAAAVSQSAWTRWHEAHELISLHLIGIWTAWMLASFVACVAAASSCAVAARRLHDRDKSSAWLLLFYGVPALVWLAPCNLLADTSAFLVGSADVAILVWQLVELGFMRGTIGTNNYGSDPLLADLHERRFADLHQVT